MGITAENRHNIFEPFFTTKQDVGTGLGLWVAQELVAKYRGQLRMRSRTGEGRSGTVFTVFLPDAEEGKSSAQCA